MIRQTFPDRPALQWALRILALLGAVCAMFLLARRVQAELRSDSVGCAISYADVQTLAAADGRSEQQWLDDLKHAGLAYLIVTDDAGAAAAQRAGLATGRMGDHAEAGDAFLIPEIRDDALASAALDLSGAACLACVEDLARTGLLLPANLDPDALPCPTVKTLYMMERYRAYDPDDAPYAESCNILFRAATERGMRLLILRPLMAESGIVADPGVYASLLGDLAARLAPRGLRLGAAASALEAPALHRLLLSGALLLAVCAAVLLVGMIPRLPGWLPGVLLAAGSVAAAGLGLLRPSAAMLLGSFAAAVLGGLGAALLLYAVWRDHASGQKRAIHLYISVLLRLLSLGVLTGLYVGALLSCRSYMLGFTVFRGVKAAQFAPLLAVALALALAVRVDGGSLLPTGRRRSLGIAALVVLIVLGAAVLLLRSGDAGRFVSDYELRARNALERVLFVRPRSKEMLLAVPAAALFALARKRRLPLLGILFGVLSALETVSVINSFCHIVTPVHVTLIRTLLGAGIGFVFGFIACLILSPLFRKNAKQP